MANPLSASTLATHKRARCTHTNAPTAKMQLFYLTAFSCLSFAFAMDINLAHLWAKESATDVFLDHVQNDLNVRIPDLLKLNGVSKHLKRFDDVARLKLTPQLKTQIVNGAENSEQMLKPVLNGNVQVLKDAWTAVKGSNNVMNAVIIMYHINHIRQAWNGLAALPAGAAGRADIITKFRNTHDEIFGRSKFADTDDALARKTAKQASNIRVMDESILQEHAEVVDERALERKIAAFERYQTDYHGTWPTKYDIDRKHLFEEGLVLLDTWTPRKLREKFKIEFKDEPGQDYGGLKIEFLDELGKAFLTQTGLFTEYPETKAFYISFDSYERLQSGTEQEKQEVRKYCRALGRLIGLYMRNNVQFGANIITPFFKHLTGGKMGMSDYKELLGDTLYTSFQQCIANPDPTLYLQTMRFRSIFPDSDAVPLTKWNHKDWAVRCVTLELITWAKEQMDLVREGLRDVVSDFDLASFNARELREWLCGYRPINVADWKANITYQGDLYNQGCTAETEQIKWLWEFLEAADDSTRKNLLKYTTASVSVPPGGFKNLRNGQGQPEKFQIFCFPNGTEIGSATCSNKLLLPLIPDKATFMEGLALKFGIDDDVSNFTQG